MKKQLLLLGFITLAGVGLTGCVNTNSPAATPKTAIAPGITCDSLKKIINNPPPTETQQAIAVYKGWYNQMNCK